jgi:hypothetical protein
MAEKKFEIDDAVAIKETDSAILVEADLFDEEQWIPKSQIHDDSEVFDAGDNSDGTLVVKEWFARKKEWI